jgi:serine/threonine protein kinase
VLWVGGGGGIHEATAVGKYTWEEEVYKDTKNVYRGQCVRTGLEVIKKVACYSDSGQGVPYHIVREVSILKGVDHENVVRLVEVAHREDDVSLVYEFLPKDLRQLLDLKRERLQQEEMGQFNLPAPGGEIFAPGSWREDLAMGTKQMKHYFLQVLKGVSFLHSRCILHRDLKPTDLRIDDTNTVKISNFRLARTFTLPLRTYTHEVVTLWYRAPEILLGKTRYVRRVCRNAVEWCRGITAVLHRSICVHPTTPEANRDKCQPSADDNPFLFFSARVDATGTTRRLTCGALDASWQRSRQGMPCLWETLKLINCTKSSSC